MPLYDFACKHCKHIFERFSVMDDKDKIQCPLCGGKCETLITQSTTKSKPVIYSYYCNGTGEYITGPAQRQRILKEKGLVEVGDGLT